MKWNPSNPKAPEKPRTVKKTIIIDCWTKKEYDVNRKTTKIIDGMEIGKQVELDNGVKLAIAGEGKYHTLGNPKERWAEVAEVRVEPDGEYGDGELLGWTPLFSPKKPQTPKKNVGARASADRKARPVPPKAAQKSGKPTGGSPKAAPRPDKPAEKSHKAAPDPQKAVPLAQPNGNAAILTHQSTGKLSPRPKKKSE